MEGLVQIGNNLTSSDEYWNIMEVAATKGMKSQDIRKGIESLAKMILPSGTVNFRTLCKQYRLDSYEGNLYNLLDQK